MRVDDAGVEHVVGLYPFESSARCVAVTLEARGHKQGYFVEAQGEAPRVVERNTQLAR